MKVQKHYIKFDFTKLVDNELINTSSFINNDPKLSSDMNDFLSFYTKNSSIPFYYFTWEEVDHIDQYMSDYYLMLEDALNNIFNKDTLMYQTINKFFDCDMIRLHGKVFTEYAKYTFNNNHRSIYGRFDVAYDPKGRIKGVYEFNGDTPTMLYESTVLQDNFTIQVTGSNESQLNEWYGRVSSIIDRSVKNVVAVCNTRFVDDTATSEIMSQALSNLSQNNNCSLIDINNLDYDHASIYKPWVISNSDIYLDTIFVLSPWEEMMVNFPEGFYNWDKWVDHVTFYEPAWKWFMSHKGMMAYVTHLLESDSAFYNKWGHLNTLRTYLTPDKFIESKMDYVSKPVIGRMSMNIEIHEYNSDSQNYNNIKTDGTYNDVPKVYQEYCSPGISDFGNNFILGIWTSPKVPNSSNTSISNISIREFDNSILSLSNERFVPHIIN